MSSSSSFFANFIAKLPSEQAAALTDLRQKIVAAAPEAVEGVSTGVPAFKYKGKYLVSMNAAKEHLSLFVMRGDALKQLKSDIKGFELTNVALRFTPDNLIPFDLVKQIVHARMAEIDSK